MEICCLFQLDPTVSEGFFGLVVGGYSLVQMLLTPLMGIWADRMEQIRLPLLICNAFMLVGYPHSFDMTFFLYLPIQIGNVIYCFVEVFPFAWIKYVFLVSRLVSGIGPSSSNSMSE
jgi:MFS family permease